MLLLPRGLGLLRKSLKVLLMVVNFRTIAAEASTPIVCMRARSSPNALLLHTFVLALWRGWRHVSPAHFCSGWSGEVSQSWQQVCCSSALASVQLKNIYCRRGLASDQLSTESTGTPMSTRLHATMPSTLNTDGIAR